MKSKFFYCVILLCLFSCSNFFENLGTDEIDFRDESDTDILINNGSIIGNWEETAKWNNGQGEFAASWDIVDVKYSDSYEFFVDNTFISNINSIDCSGGSGTYSIEGSKLTLTYNCASGDTKEILIDEFFFREKYIVFIKGNDTSNISMFQLVK